MNINILASSSKGNAYTVDDGKTKILLECGLPIKKLKQALNYKLNTVDFLLLTHEHKDHSKAVKDVIKAGISVYTSLGTAKACEIANNPYLTVIKAYKQFEVGTMVVKPFDVKHDCAEPLGYYIKSKESGDSLVFMTDSYYCKYFFAPTIIMIECSYQEELLNENVKNESVPLVYGTRLRRSHFELKNLLDWLWSCDLSKCKAIYLLHFSGKNSNPEECQRKVEQATGIPTYI